MDFPVSLIPPRKSTSPMEKTRMQDYTTVAAAVQVEPPPMPERETTSVANTAGNDELPTETHNLTVEKDTVEIEISVPDKAPEEAKEHVTEKSDELPFGNVTSDFLVSAYTLRELKDFAKTLGCTSLGNKKAEVAAKIIEARSA